MELQIEITTICKEGDVTIFYVDPPFTLDNFGLVIKDKSCKDCIETELTVLSVDTVGAIN